MIPSPVDMRPREACGRNICSGPSQNEQRSPGIGWIVTQASSSTGQGQPTHRESRRTQDERVEQLTFNELFDHAVTACAEAQRLSALSSDSVKRARLEVCAG